VDSSNALASSYTIYIVILDLVYLVRRIFLEQRKSYRRRKYYILKDSKLTCMYIAVLFEFSY
jgi:hypothetical protein